jgi:hypothetical protein
MRRGLREFLLAVGRLRGRGRWWWGDAFPVRVLGLLGEWFDGKVSGCKMKRINNIGGSGEALLYTHGC